MTVETSILVRDIQGNDQVRSRVNALVQTYLWDGAGDPRQSYDLDQLMWAIASSTEIQSFVATAMAANTADPNMTTPAIVQITDTDLNTVLFGTNGAWVRLYG